MPTLKAAMKWYANAMHREVTEASRHTPFATPTRAT